mmetsp:Transcript_58309/g.190151  ORF Transcript_58309/g.190151 Transcript_58309/m.190151 type:complete len:224 (-) Transcript_58309:56-727(-)
MAQPAGKLTQYDCLVKLLLIGDSGVGKSSLLVRFAEDKFSPQLTNTIGVDFKVKMLELGGRRVKLQIWDTAGQERFHTITQQYYRNAMGIVLVYDVCDEASFNNIRRWMAQIAQHGTEGTDRLLVGNKADCDKQARAVDAARGQALADEYGITFLEASARSGQNVKEVFTLLAETVQLRLQGRDGAKSSSIVADPRCVHLSAGTGAKEASGSGCCGGGGGGAG